MRIISETLEKLLNYFPKSNFEKREKEFQNWLKCARKTLVEFVEQNPSRMDGYTFTKSIVDYPFEEIRTIKTLPNGRFMIEARYELDSWNPDIKRTKYGEDKNGYISLEIAEEIFNKSDLESSLYIDMDLKKELTPRVFSNRQRNFRLEELKKQTGFDIKSEIGKTISREKSKGFFRRLLGR